MLFSKNDEKKKCYNDTAQVKFRKRKLMYIKQSIFVLNLNFHAKESSQ